MRLLLCACAGLGLAGAAGAAGNQGAAGTTGAATIDAPRLSYVSVFTGLPPAADPKPIAWAQSNELMARLRGHAGHLRQAPATGADKP